MEERLSLKAIEDYSDDYASKVVAIFFSKKDKITGAEIRTLSPIPQVNLFVIRELLRAWKHEGQKLRSPYFDYSAPEVAEALLNFQNLLSQHISISKENFQPLLKKAAGQTIHLILSPYDFFSETLERQGVSHVRTEDLRNEIKYLKINRPPLERLVQRLEEKKLDLIAGTEAFGLLDQILEEVNFTPEDIEGYVEQFSRVLPMQVEAFYDRKAPVPASPPPAAKAVEPPKPVRPPVPSVPAPEAKTNPKVLVADSLSKIGRIKDGLTINQKFMFTKILFNGDFEIFSSAIEKLDRFDNLPQAMNYLEQNYPEWDRESEEYEEFVSLVTKRYS